MGNPKAFLYISRQEGGYRPLNERVNDYQEVEKRLNTVERREQASRCMDCGVPFCHWSCPLGNRQPEWQDRLYRDDIQGAYTLLSQTDDFPEFTGRVCPALCEKGCVLNKQHQAVTVRENELAIVERAFAEGRIKPCPPKHRSGKRVAVIGSGPAGLACANQLNRRGHLVTVFEKNEFPGGLLRFGIPDFKLDKKVIDRRVALMEAEGVEFKCNVKIGDKKSISDLLQDYDAVCLAIGAEIPRDLKVEGRNLKGVHFALELLQQQNRINAGIEIAAEKLITAKGKNVLVIGGGDTGSDCVGTANRQGALSVTQIEIMPKPPEVDNPATPWPYWPNVLKTSSSHEEGCERLWYVDTRRFISDENGRVKEVEIEEVEWIKDEESGRMNLVHTGRKSVIKADLVLLAMGFTGPTTDQISDIKEIEKDVRGNIKTDPLSHATSKDRVYATGDSVTGASLVVRCIASGREVAKAIHEYLTKDI